MNREIKFRAFVRRSESSDNINKMRYESNETIFGWDSDGVTMDLMQYTGLKDKNGKEIYEGDIVRLITDNDPVFGADSYNFVMEFITNGWYYRTKTGFVNACHNRFVSSEVVGNIYEDAQLLFTV